MASDAIKRIVDETEDIAEKLRLTALLPSAHDLQELATYYNWDDGFAIPTAIANHPKCDLGVALNLFWLAEAHSWVLKEIEVDQYNRNWATFCEMITVQILSGKYVTGSTTFRLGLGVAQIHKYGKNGVPELLLTDVIRGC